VLLPLAASSQQTPLSQMQRALEDAEKSLCKSLDMKNCKKSPVRKRTTANAKPVAPTRPVLAETPAAPVPPVPQERPSSVIAQQPPAEPPQLKPTQLKPTQQKLAQKNPTLKKVPMPKLRVEVEPVKTASVVKQPKIPEPTVAPDKTGSLLTTKPQIPEASPKLLNCAKTLAELGATFRPAATPVNGGRCNIINPVKLSSVVTSGKPVTFPDEPIFACEFAAAFVGWARNVASPIAKATAQNAIIAMGTGPGFDCRGRNGDATAKLSEHGSGNAVDIEYVRLADGSRLTVKDNGPAIKALRASACEQFTTVLGPGSNSAHAEHLHFDMALRKGGYRICD
jgi:hypothetical protein